MVFSFSTRPQHKDNNKVKALRHYCDRHGESFSAMILEAITLFLAQKGVDYD